MEKNKEIFDYPPPLLHSHNPTDWNIESYSVPYMEKDIGNFYTDKWQRSAVKDAISRGGIRLYGLVFILAKTEIYNDLIPDLWKHSGFNDDRSHKFPQWDDCMSKNKQGRAWAWYWLLCRWTIFETPKVENTESINELKSYYFSDLKKIKPLLSLYNLENGMFKEVRETEEQSPKHYIKLSEFKNYLKKIDKSIPLPKLLFSEPDELSEPEPVGLNKPPANLLDLIKRSKPEVEMIYEAIRLVGFSGHNAKAGPEGWKSAAVKKFNGSRSKFKLIKDNFLLDQDIYHFNSAKEKRDFTGKILQKILKDNGLDSGDYTQLYKIYIQGDKSTDKTDKSTDK